MFYVVLYSRFGFNRFMQTCKHTNIGTLTHTNSEHRKIHTTYDTHVRRQANSKKLTPTKRQADG